ncbi:MAG TPA: nucleotidyltransferase domain-containing protein [Solirubrobacterales bacterium]|nr:nucleotidyltransferase domain-containing protein [Solirubrobacterales bacterium]
MATSFDPLIAADLSEPQRSTLQSFATRLREALGEDLLALWLYGSRARGEGVHPESDVDLMVIAKGGRERYQRVAWDLSEEAAISEGESPFSYSVHVHDREWLSRRREIESFFIQEVDRDKIVITGSALE